MGVKCEESEWFEGTKSDAERCKEDGQVTVVGKWGSPLTIISHNHSTAPLLQLILILNPMLLLITRTNRCC